MDFEKVLVKRVSARKYNDRMPDDATIQKVIDAALLAPIVHMHKLHLSVVTSHEVMKLADDAAAEFFDKPDVKKAAGIPDGYDALASVIIGYSDTAYPERKVKPEFIPVSYVR